MHNVLQVCATAFVVHRESGLLENIGLFRPKTAGDRCEFLLLVPIRPAACW
jgi:hypothetical protein